MKPISLKWLPQTITLFNLWKDPETGQISRYRTFLDGVRVDSRKTSLAASVRGQKAEYQVVVFVDPVSTQGLDGDLARKIFAHHHIWVNMADEEKRQAWTLNVGDWLIFELGQKTTKAPDIKGSGLTEQQFRQEYGVRVISALPPTIDKDGSVHHWEAILD